MNPTFIISVFFSLLLSCGGLLWFWLLNRYRTQGELLQTESRKWVPWNGFPHVALAFFIYIALQWLWAILLRRWFGLQEEDYITQLPQIFTWLLAGNTVLILVTVVLIVTFLRVDLGTSLADLGLRLGKIKSDVLLGIIAFVAAAPIVFFIQYILKWAYDQLAEEKAAHPIEKMLRDNPSMGVIFWAICAAVVAAPIVEEFLFRVILQGWLEKAFIRTKNLADCLLYTSPSPRD